MRVWNISESEKQKETQQGVLLGSETKSLKSPGEWREVKWLKEFSEGER